MIQFANEQTEPLVREMWKVCFEDSDEFIDLYFSSKYKHENTLLYFDDNKPVASLQMLPYTINFYGQEISFAYLAGLCTLPEYRKRGYMAELIYEAHRVIIEREIPLAILIPAEEWLFGFYEKFGYTQVFEKGENKIPLKKILDTYRKDDEAYTHFDSIFRSLDFCVQKSFEDFIAIKKEYIMDGYPEKSDLWGMACILDEWALLELYAKNNTQQNFKIKVENSFSDKDFVYSINKGHVELLFDVGVGYDISVDLSLLCRLLFGYKLEEVDVCYHPYFKSHHTIMNLMLE